MPKLFKKMKDISQFEEDLYFEILKSEKIRVFILVIGFGILSFILSMFTFVIPELNPLQMLLGGKFPMKAFFIFAVCALTYEIIVFKMVGIAIKKRIRPPEAPRFGNAFVETSLPTIILLLINYAVGPVISFNSPAILIYFIFIILSTLRLKFSLSLFTGLVAGIEYLIIGYIYLPTGYTNLTEKFLHSLLPIGAKSFLFVVAGVVAGFVANELMKRLTSSMQILSERNKIVGMFGQYVSPAVVEKLLAQKTEFTGEVKYVTIMFLDIRNFTKFCEKKTPEEVVDYLNNLFGHLISIINQNNGIINKFLGDGFMAVFGAPISDGKDVHNAVKSATEIIKKLEELNKQGIIPSTRIGIGLHSGQAVTGNVGSEERKEYTIIGDTVNLASRVEQLNKEYQSTLLITDSVYGVVKEEYRANELPPVTVKGREEPVRIYRII
jgi:adenylate cyclase